jgi:hypothetical protein
MKVINTNSSSVLEKYQKDIESIGDELIKKHVVFIMKTICSLPINKSFSFYVGKGWITEELKITWYWDYSQNVTFCPTTYGLDIMGCNGSQHLRLNRFDHEIDVVHYLKSLLG